MTYDDAHSYLFSLLGSIRKDNFRLERMERLMAALGHPERGAGILHIAGTNGKGSTAAMIEAGLIAAGRSVGTYTSPHLSRINERFRVNGLEASDEATAAAIAQVRSAIEAIVANEGGSAHPTFFEAATATALCLFRSSGTACRIIEVGLGGRWDASSVVEPELAAITRISLDHEGLLGSDLMRIAAEKAAIIKPGCLAIIGLQQERARAVLLRRCREVGARAVDVASTWRADRREALGGRWAFEAVSETRQFPVRMSLAGEHQVENALTAVAALDALGVAPEAITDGLANTVWPGRLEFVGANPTFLLDAAHNPGGALALAEFLRSQAAGRRVVLIYGSSREKAVDEVAGRLFPRADRVILTRSRVKRALRPETVFAIAGHHHAAIETIPDLPASIERARAMAGAEDWIVIAGSLFLVGEARDLLVSS